MSGSGSSPFEKADVKGKNILIECKAKEKESKSHTIQEEWLKTLKRNALGMGTSHYALSFDFGKEEDYYIIDEKQMKQFLHYIESEEYNDSRREERG